MTTKRAIHILSAAIVVGAVSGWALAYRCHLDRRERARLSEIESATLPMHRFATLVRESDTAQIVYLEGREERIVRIKDPAWLLRLARVLDDSRGEALPFNPLRITSPSIRLYSKGVRVLELSAFGQCLRGLSATMSGDFVVGPDASAAITTLERSI